MYKTSLAALAALTLCGASALAADLPAARAPLPVFTWTGFHVGANVGGVLDSANRLSGTYPIMSPVMGASYSNPGLENHATGGLGGVQIGYDVQFSQGVVLGVEADVDVTSLSRTRSITPADMPSTLGVSYHSVLDALGTVRGRVGYAYGPALVYGTGGLAFGIGNRRAELSTAAGAPLAGINLDFAEVGYAVGGGVEYALPMVTPYLGGRLSARLEYLHYQIGHDTRPLSVGATAYDLHVRDSGDLVRVGLNYRF